MTWSQQAAQYEKPLYLYAPKSLLPCSEMLGQLGAYGSESLLHTFPIERYMGALPEEIPLTPQAIGAATNGSPEHQINQADQTY